MRVSDSYVSLRLSFSRSLRLGNQRSLFVWLSHVFFDGRIPCMPHTRLGFHETSLSIL